jgi:uncharacterized protein YfkK (UPF0435 family)
LTPLSFHENIELNLPKIERMRILNLTEKTSENIEYMITQITTKLKMVNAEAIKATNYNEEVYDDLQEIFEMVMKKNTFSPNEMQAIVEELGNLRKQ